MRNFSWTSYVFAHGQVALVPAALEAVAAGAPEAGGPPVAAVTTAVEPPVLGQASPLVVPLALLNQIIRDAGARGDQPLDVDLEFVTRTPARLRVAGLTATVTAGTPITTLDAAKVSSQTLDAILKDEAGKPQKITLIGFLCIQDFWGSGPVSLSGTIRMASTGEPIANVPAFDENVNDNQYKTEVTNTSQIVVKAGDKLEVHMDGVLR